MEVLRNSLVCVVILYLGITLSHGAEQHERKPYIVYMGDLPAAGVSVSHHQNMLKTAVGDEKLARESKIHSYGKSFNGFVAKLLPHEAKKLSDEDSVVSVFPSKILKLHTTRSWDFLRLSQTSKRQNTIESDIIVGVLDTGIWVGSPSFNDKGFGPPPAKWKGKCVKGANFTGCNNKVIGAKYFNMDNNTEDPNPSPLDIDGHGTHTSSTVAGVEVEGASLYGIAKGTARGGVPSARVAAYKVCWGIGCSDMDILAAFDEAIDDGVDIISVSIGGPSRSYYEDAIAIGAFHAMRRGILTSCSGGNDGPYVGTVENVAPWILTVAATGLDRQFTSVVKLATNDRTYGIAVNTFSPKKQMFPLISGAQAAANVTGDNYGNASACDYGTLSKEKVMGKIVYCLDSVSQDSTIKEFGGEGVIMAVDGKMDYALNTLISGAVITSKDGKKIDQYINSNKNPQAVILKTRTTPVTAPFVASFSSRGPQLISLNILKPDIAAPGVDILAAYSKFPTISGDPTDNRHSLFNIISGTSMACPHATAAAAYVKSFHPDWSPAAIKSALMTTATPMKIKDKDEELGSGAGQINPIGAVHPGLIYDLYLNDYVRFLCKEGYSSKNIGLLLGNKQGFNCSNFKPVPGTDGLNYPTMHKQLDNPNAAISAVFHRKVTHVGYGYSEYKSHVTSPKGLSIQVIPDTLKFDRLHQKRTFKVVVKGGPMPSGTDILSALLEWNDSKHSVKSHIVVYRGLSMS